MSEELVEVFARKRGDKDYFPGEWVLWMGTFEVRLSYLGRLRGFLGCSPADPPLVLLPCKSVHTFGMSFPLDIAFIGQGGLVVKAERNVRPGRVLSCEESCLVLERAASPDFWFRVGMGMAFDYRDGSIERGEEKRYGYDFELRDED